jgi:hypothetical protein
MRPAAALFIQSSARPGSPGRDRQGPQGPRFPCGIGVERRRGGACGRGFDGADEITGAPPEPVVLADEFPGLATRQQVRQGTGFQGRCQQPGGRFWRAWRQRGTGGSDADGAASYAQPRPPPIRTLRRSRRPRSNTRRCPTRTSDPAPPHPDPRYMSTGPQAGSVCRRRRRRLGVRRPAVTCCRSRVTTQQPLSLPVTAEPASAKALASLAASEPRTLLVGLDPLYLRLRQASRCLPTRPPCRRQATPKCCTRTTRTASSR